MSISTGQVGITTSGTVLCAIPPGPATVVVSNLGTGVIYLGAGATVTTASGMPVPSGGVFPVDLYTGSGPSTLRAITLAGTATAGFMISTSYGLSQPGVQ